MSQCSLLDWASYWKEIRPSENKTWFHWLNLLQEGLGTPWHFGIWKNRKQGLEKKQGKCKATTVKVIRTNQGKIKVFTFLLCYSMHLRAEGELSNWVYFNTEISDQYLKMHCGSLSCYFPTKAGLQRHFLSLWLKEPLSTTIKFLGNFIHFM